RRAGGRDRRRAARAGGTPRRRDVGRMSDIVHADLRNVSDRPVGSVITVRGKELPADATVADARRLFESSSVQLIPVLDGNAYRGAVTREHLADAPAPERILRFPLSRPPSATASTPAAEALLALDDMGGRRLVVLAHDGVGHTGVGCVAR